MSVYDHIKCLYPLPDTEFPDEEFQTKCLGTWFNDYTITVQGRLIHHTVREESVPEHERPYFGTAEYESDPFAKMCGSMRLVPTGDVDTNYNGLLNFYTSRVWVDGKRYLVSGGDSGGTYALFNDGQKKYGRYEAYEYLARFNNGQLETIERVANDEHGCAVDVPGLPYGYGWLDRFEIEPSANCL